MLGGVFAKLYKKKRRLRSKYRYWRRERRGPPAAIQRMPADVVARLESMLRGERIEGSDGTLHELHSGTKIHYVKGAVLHDWHDRLRPELSIETGLAYGYSTLFVLGSMKREGYGHHMALDPYQFTSYAGVGTTQAAHVGMQDRFTFLEEDSATGLARLASEGRRAQWIFIDGDHRYDGVMLDFVLGARMLDVGGVIILDDLWLKSVSKVAKFVRRNRPDFVQEKVPANLAVFRKVAEDERPWTHFKRF